MEGTKVAPMDFGKKSLLVISGASRGIGSSIAVNLAKRVAPGSIFLLLARSADGLQETKRNILAVGGSCDVRLSTLDLSKPNVDEYRKVFESLDLSDVHYAVFVHNAGSAGVLKKAVSLNDVGVWREYFDLNLFAVSALNSVFVETIRGKVKQLVVVNITSLCGRKPFKDMAMYGAGKAARDQYFRVFALEEPDVAVLNYSPGPVDTVMFNEVLTDAESEELRKDFQTWKETALLKPEQTVEKLLGILGEGKFESGDTLDYYDRI